MTATAIKLLPPLAPIRRNDGSIEFRKTALVIQPRVQYIPSEPIRRIPC